MRVLLDNNMPKVLRKLLRGHLVIHVFDLGWAQTPDHQLLPRAEADKYEVLVTSDKRMVYQQNNSSRKIPLVVLSTNSRKSIRLAHEAILSAVEQSSSGSYTKLELSRQS